MQWEKSSTVSDHPEAPDELDRKAAKKWENVLQYMLGGGDPPFESCTKMLVRLKVIKRDDGTMTETGFRFLLKDTQQQLWMYVREYIETAAERNQVRHCSKAY